MGENIHVTRARVVKEPGRGMKTAYLDAFPDTPVPYGIHGGIKKFYKTEPEVERPATLDHLVMAVAGRLNGKMESAPAASGIKTPTDKPVAPAEGIIEDMDSVPPITTIRV